METRAPVIVMDPAVSGRVRPPRRQGPDGAHAVSALVRKLDGFAPLTEADRAALAGLTRYVRPVERHTVLVEQDSVAEHAHIVLAGFASRYKRRATGRRQILAYLIPGDLCDLGALHGCPLDHTIETLTRCRIARVPRGLFRPARPASPYRVHVAAREARRRGDSPRVDGQYRHAFGS